MGGNDDPRKTMGPLPTVFLGAGPGAAQTLAELARHAQSLTVPVQGPFGLVLMDSQGEGLYTCDWPCASELRIPEPALVREQGEFIGRDKEKLVASVSFLVRRLRSVEPGTDSASGGHVRLNAYAVADLSDPPTVASVLGLLQVLRQVDTAVDTTVLALTGRTAATQAAGEGAWFETCQTLLQQLQEGCVAQRVYLLDGCTTDKCWLERPEQLHRLGGEFLFYHGLVCHGLLRQKEYARIGAGESLLNVCGSFGCHTITSDLAVVAERMAERLAREDLMDLHQRTIPSAWLGTLQEQARLLVERVATISEKGSRRQASLGGEPHGHSQARGSENDEIAAAVRQAIQNVCTREPLVSLCLFFQLLRPKLDRLLSQYRFRERARTRQQVAEVFRQQDQSTYEPMRRWLARPQTHWIDRFTPVQSEISEVAVSRPAAFNSYLTGWVVLVLGLLEVAAGVFWRDRFLVVGGGLVSLAASVPMTLPSGWIPYPRDRMVDSREERRRLVSYRRGPSGRVCRVSIGLILAGLIGVTWPLWPASWTLTTSLGAVAVVAMTAIGSALVAAGPRQKAPPYDPARSRAGMRPDPVSPKEAPGHVNPPVWWWRTAGLLLLALAWTVLVLGSEYRQGPVPGERGHARPTLGDITRPSSILHLTGLALVAAGAGLALFPRSGRTHLVDRVDQMPQPLAGGIANPVQEGGLPQGMTALAAWVNRLALDPQRCLEPFGSRETRSTPDTLLDFLAVDWESQLVQAFRRTFEARSGKSLRALALGPLPWTQCITSQMSSLFGASPSLLASDERRSGRDDSRATHHELAFRFALQAVHAWIESHTLAELLSFLQIDLGHFGSHLGRLAAAHWPTPRANPDRNAMVVAVSKGLWDVVAPLAAPGSAKPGRPDDRPVSHVGCAPHTIFSAGKEGCAVHTLPPRTFSSSSARIGLVPLDWDSRGEKIVVVRMVQGLSQGWRGFPGLPGQTRGGNGS